MFDDKKIDTPNVSSGSDLSSLTTTELVRLIEKHSQTIAHKLANINQRKTADGFNKNLINEILAFQEAAYSRIIREGLKKNKIDFTIEYQSETDPSEPYLHGLKYKYFIISPSNSSPLNKFALAVHNKLGLKLAYSPYLNRFMNFEAGFNPRDNSYLLQIQAITETEWSEAAITTHEMKHALFHAERLGLTQPQISAPVHGYMFDTSKMNSAEDPYAKYVNFEEMVTYAYSITAFAKKIRRENTENDRLRKSLNYSIQTFYSISQRSEAKIRLALTQLNSMDPKLKLNPDTIEISISESEKIVLRVPKAAAQEAISRPVLYCVNFLTKALKLAEFNRNYVSNSSTEFDVSYFENLRSAQVSFLEKL